MEPKGRKLLKVVGTLLLIAAAVSAIISLVGLLGGGLMLHGADASGKPAEMEKMGIFATVYFVFSLVCAVIYLLAGICGIRNAKNVGAASICMHYGKVMLVIGVINVILMFVMGSFRSMNAVSIVFSLIGTFLLPVLYLIGAAQNKKSA